MARELGLSELFAAGKEGRRLVSLADFAHVSFHTEQNAEGKQEVWTGGPNELKIVPYRGDDFKPRGTGDDLDTALRDLFSQVTRSRLIVSRPPEGARGQISVVGRYRGGRFTI